MLISRRRLLWPQSAGPKVWPGLTIRPRSEWTDSQPSSALEPEEVRFLLVHHTAGNSEHREGDVPAILQGIRAFHVGQKGWPDIAYNFLIDRHGEVWEGRAGSLDGPVRGDATGGNQGFSQLLSLIGDFTAEPPTKEAQASLVGTLAWLADRYGIDTDPSATVEFTSRGSNRWPAGTVVSTSPIAGHRDMSHTSCPGEAFYPLLAEQIAPMVHESRNPPVTTSTPITTEPPVTGSTTTAAAITTSSTTTTTAVTPTTNRPQPPTTLQAAETSSGFSRVRFPVLSLLGGAVVALIGWRARRMSGRG